MDSSLENIIFIEFQNFISRKNEIYDRDLNNFRKDMANRTLEKSDPLFGVTKNKVNEIITNLLKTKNITIIKFEKQIEKSYRDQRLEHLEQLKNNNIHPDQLII